MGLLLCFNQVKSFAIDADDFGHGDESIVVDMFDESEDLGALATASHNDEHTAFLLRIPTLAVEYRDATMEFFANLLGNLFVMVGDDGELHALSGRAHRVVDENHRDEQDDITRHNLIPVVEDHEAAAHDDKVKPHQYAPHREVLVLVDDSGDNIRAARGAVVQEHKAQSSALDTGSEHRSHERLVADDLGQSAVGLLENLLHQGEEERDAGRGVDGLGEELETQHLQTDGQKDGVNDEIAVLGREARRIENDGRHTRHAARSELIRQHEEAEAKAVGKTSEGDEEIVLNFI